MKSHEMHEATFSSEFVRTYDCEAIFSCIKLTEAKSKAIGKLQCHGEMGMFYLGVPTGIHEAETHMDVTSNPSFGHSTVIHA